MARNTQLHLPCQSLLLQVAGGGVRTAPLTETGPDDTAQIDEQDHEGKQSNTTRHTLDVFYFLVPRRGLTIHLCNANRLIIWRIAMKVYSFLLTLFFVSPHPLLNAQTSPMTPRHNESLRQELLEMGKKDQQYRDMMIDLMKQGIGNPETKKQFEAIKKVIDQVDNANLTRLEEIIKEYGWPGINLVGKEAAQAAFWILQHGPLTAQKKYFPLLKEAAGKNNVPSHAVAMLEDRILMREGKQQVYGTQVVMNEKTGKLELWPIADEENVDTRRASVGLPPLVEYLKEFGLEYIPSKKRM
jgi:hypothetical protein